MNASLDTNVIIHLYKAGCQDILFSRFEKLKVYEFIRNVELARHAANEIVADFDKDVERGKIELISVNYLRSIHMYGLFEEYVKTERILYEGSDLGEVYAIALAKTLGCISLVTDDIKERGPHYTLMRTPDSEVIPFAFYEILFLEFLECRMTAAEVIRTFDRVAEVSALKMNCESKFKFFLKRFWSNPYSDSEKSWMKSFCSVRGIDFPGKAREFGGFLKNSNK